MKLKLDGSGKAEVQDGKPVYVRDDGSEIAFDAVHAVGKIKELSDERDGLRTRATTAETALKAWEGKDPAKVQQAIDKLADLERKKLIDAGEVEAVKAEINGTYEAVLGAPLADLKAKLNGHKTVVEALGSLSGNIRRLTVGALFAKSPYFTSLDGKEPKTLLTPDIAERVFGEFFEPTADGRAVAKVNGRELTSPNKPGDPATFDEAIGQLIDLRPDKNLLLRDTSGSGAGAKGGAAANGHPTQPNTEGLSPEDRLARAYAGGAARR